MSIQCLNKSGKTTWLTESDLARLAGEAKNNNADAQHQLGLWLMSQQDPEKYKIGMSFLEQAAASGKAESQCMLGNVYLETIQQSEEYYEKGAAWYRKAADSGSAAGLARLAYLYLQGVGVTENHRMAFSCYEKLARQGVPGALSNIAYMYSHGVGVDKSEADAISWYRRAAQAGEPRGFYNLGLRYACGHHVQADPLKGLVFLQQALNLGYPGSRELVERLTGESNEALLCQVQELASNIDPALIEDPGMKLPEEMSVQLNTSFTGMLDGNTETEVVCWSPRVFRIHNFLSYDECDHLIDIAASNTRWTEAELAGNTKMHDGLTTYLTYPICDATVYNIEHRIGKTTWYPVHYGETMSILRFKAGDNYPEHVDFYPPGDAEFDASYKLWGQRVITFLMYLNDVEEGGETAYLRTAGKKVKPEKGMAVMHFNCLPSGEIDKHSVHAGLPIRKGEKWLVRKAICEKDSRKPSATVSQS